MTSDELPRWPVITIDPGVRFGQPQIGGVGTADIAGTVMAGATVDATAAEYGRTRHEVLLACWWEATGGAYQDEWRAWVDEVAPWLGGHRKPLDVATLPDPPARTEQDPQPAPQQTTNNGGTRVSDNMRGGDLAPHIEAERDRLIHQLQRIRESIEQAEKRIKDAEEAADKELDPLSAKVPDEAENPTVIEYLTRGAVLADWHLANEQHGVTIAQAFLDLQRLRSELADVEMRLGQIDELVEVGSIAAGNSEQLAIIALDAKEAALDAAHAQVCLDLAKQRLALTKRMHKARHAELRRVQRAQKAGGTEGPAGQGA